MSQDLKRKSADLPLALQSPPKALKSDVPAEDSEEEFFSAKDTDNSAEPSPHQADKSDPDSSEPVLIPPQILVPEKPKIEDSVPAAQTGSQVIAVPTEAELGGNTELVPVSHSQPTPELGTEMKTVSECDTTASEAKSAVSDTGSAASAELTH